MALVASWGDELSVVAQKGLNGEWWFTRLFCIATSLQAERNRWQQRWAGGQAEEGGGRGFSMTAGV